jgi:hypothetical protein
MVEGTAQSGWPSCIPHFFSSLEPSLPNIWSTHLARTSAYWGHPISNQLPPPLRAFLSREATPCPSTLDKACQQGSLGPDLPSWEWENQI